MTDDEDVNRALIVDRVAATNAGDRARTVEHVDEAAVLLQPHQPPMCGRSAFEGRNALAPAWTCTSRARSRKSS